MSACLGLPGQSITAAAGHEFGLGDTQHVSVNLLDGKRQVAFVSFSTVDDALAMADAFQEAARRLRLRQLEAQRKAVAAS